MHGDRIATGCVWVARTVVVGFARSVQCLAFWTAVCLPVAYLPLLLGGDAVLGGHYLLWKLLAVNVVAAVVGHRYDGTLARFERQR